MAGLEIGHEGSFEVIGGCGVEGGHGEAGVG